MKRYFTIFILLLVTEVAIAIFHFHKFVRGFLGDVLVVPLLYALIRSCTKLSGKQTLILVLGFAFSIEILQLFSIADLFGINNKVARILIGNTFDGWDLLAYWFGILPVLFIEKYRNYGTS